MAESIALEELTCEPRVPSAASPLICCVLTLCDQMKLGREGLREPHRVSHFSCHTASVSEFQNLKISSHTKQCLPFSSTCDTSSPDLVTEVPHLCAYRQSFPKSLSGRGRCKHPVPAEIAAACSTRSANASASF